MNPWTTSFEQYRQEVLGETKKKSEKESKDRWQDDDGDGKWYEKSDTDGKISDRERDSKRKWREGSGSMRSKTRRRRN